MQENNKTETTFETYFVRLKPYDPRRGQVIQRYLFRGIKFQVDRGWYHVKKEIAEALRPLHQIHTDDRSPPAFDVCTEKEAQAIDEEEGNTRKTAGQSLKLSLPRENEAETKSDEGE